MTNTAFEQDFRRLVDLLGAREGELISTLGRWDEETSDEHRSWVWYEPSCALFRIRARRVDHLSIPMAGAKGGTVDLSDGHWVLHGLSLGMLRRDVTGCWGAPHDKSDPSSEFGNRVLELPSGRRIIHGPTCSHGASAFRAGGPIDRFWARLQG